MSNNFTFQILLKGIPPSPSKLPCSQSPQAWATIAGSYSRPLSRPLSLVPLLSVLPPLINSILHSAFTKKNCKSDYHSFVHLTWYINPSMWDLSITPLSFTLQKAVTTYTFQNTPPHTIRPFHTVPSVLVYASRLLHRANIPPQDEDLQNNPFSRLPEPPKTGLNASPLFPINSNTCHIRLKDIFICYPQDYKFFKNLQNI